MNSLKGTTITIQGKRKLVRVVIDRRSVEHIANDVAMGYIPPLPNSPDEITKLLSEAKRTDTPSEVDRSGKHKKPKRVSQFQYFEFEHNGETLYANVMVQQANGTKGAEVASHRLHSITKTEKAKKIMQMPGPIVNRLARVRGSVVDR